MAVSQEILAALQWYQDHGVDEAAGDRPVNRFAVRETPAAVEPVSPPEKKSIPPIVMATPLRAAPVPVVGRSEARAQAIELALAAQTLEALKESIAKFDGIGLKMTATNMVFADGNPAAPIMLVGEAPGADEDRSGTPFVGVSGQLLDRILKSIDLDRAQQDPARALYISNLINWRPPGNRNPTPTEIEVSLPLIERHIQLVRPRLLIFSGAIAAKALLGRDDAVSKLRKSWHAYVPQTPELAAGQADAIPAIVIYHPSYLLRTPSQKRAAWGDMITIKDKLKSLKII